MESRMLSRFFGVSSWNDGVAISKLGEDCEKGISGRVLRRRYCHEFMCGSVKF